MKSVLIIKYYIMNDYEAKINCNYWRLIAERMSIIFTEMRHIIKPYH